MTILTSFPPVVDSRTTTLILGSMPGRMSLAEARYYAHPRNGFWHIMGKLYGAGPTVPYQQRLAILLDQGIGLWDVIAACTRSTSLDSDIDDTSIRANDFPCLFADHPAITTMLFNGSKAEQAFRRHVLPLLEPRHRKIKRQMLISTSPANARYSIEHKIALWSQHLPAMHLR